MGITNQQSGTNIQEVADGIYRISTPVMTPAGGFSFKKRLNNSQFPSAELQNTGNSTGSHLEL